MFVALTEKSFLSKVYGKSDSNVILILVFSVGLADGGLTNMPALVVDIIVRLRVFLTDCPLMVIDIYTVYPAATDLSNGSVRQTREVEVDSCGTHLVSWASLNVI